MSNHPEAPPASAAASNGARPEPRPLASGELTTAIVHLYRAEVGRAVSWRSRLDVTTNWAVVTMGAAMTFALGDPEPQRHVVILLSSVLMTFFLLLEARRYRYYNLWQHRVFLLERAYYAPILEGGAAPEGDWRRELAGDLRDPHYHISFVEAVGWRLRRNYIWLYLANLIIWLAKIGLHPEPLATAEQFFSRAAVGPLPGGLVLLIGVVSTLALAGVALYAHRRLCCEPDILHC